MITITAFPFAPISSVYPSHVYTGLFDLANENLVNLEFSPANEILSLIFKDFAVDPKHYGRAVYIEVSREHSPPARIFFDLADAGYLIAPTALAFCDFYFKRAYHIEAHKQLRFHYNEKVLPYGLFYTVRSDFEKKLLWRNVCAVLSRKWHKTDKIRSLKTIIHAFYPQRYAKVSDFFTLPELPACRKVMYQVRLFHVPFPGHYHHQINCNRIDLFRRLKSVLGDSLVGGIADSPEARLMAPEFITEKTGIHDYIDLIRKSSICISTEGLAETNPDKIPSYLSMARCIVSAKLRYAIPMPLVNRKHIYYFQDTKECIEICKHLLEHPDEIQRARNAAHEYFVNFGSPKKTILHCLSRALGSATPKCVKELEDGGAEP